MVELVDIYVFALAATAALSLGVGFVAWTQRAVTRAWPLVVQMLGVTAWCGSEALLWSRTPLEQQVFWLKLTYLGVSVVVVGFTLFAFDIAELEAWRTPRRTLLVSFPLAMVCIMAMTNPGGLFYEGYTAQRIGPYTHYVAQNGPLFWVYILVAYGMLLVDIFLIVRVHVLSTAVKRIHTTIVLTGALVPFVVSVLNQFSPTQLEGIESTAFFVTGLLFLFALIRGQLLDPSGNVVTAEDVQKSKRRELELRTINRELEDKLEAAGLYRTLMELTPDVVFVIDSDMRVALGNTPAARMMGRSAEQLKGMRVAEMFGPVGTLVEGRLRQVGVTGRPLEFEECLPFGESEVWLKTSLAALSDLPGFVLGVSRDITDSKRLEVALREHADESDRLATHDSLTGVGNRRAFMVALDRAVALAGRGTSSAMLFMDVDGFKRCNDERGHAFGDEVLISVASLLKNEVREVDLVARIGGDGYAALLAGTDETGALEVAKRMRASVEALGVEIGIPIDLSVGIAGVGADVSAVHVLSTADQRMYEYKAAHRSAQEAAEKT